MRDINTLFFFLLSKPVSSYHVHMRDSGWSLDTLRVIAMLFNLPQTNGSGMINALSQSAGYRCR